MADTHDAPPGPFALKDCTLITRMAGIESALTLRELRERVAVCPLECIYHHFCETLIRPTFDDPEFSNDFATWAKRSARDLVLAERLGFINPYGHTLEETRQTVLEILAERMAEDPHRAFSVAMEPFEFMMAATVVFDTGNTIDTPQSLARSFDKMSTSSIYYHFLEARRRTDSNKDDFTEWLDAFGKEGKPLAEALSTVSAYFKSLWEVRAALADVGRQTYPKAAS